MPRRYYRRRSYSRGLKKKYSWEHSTFSGSNGAVEADTAWEGRALLISSSDVGGMRKAKNFKLTLNIITNGQNNIQIPVFWALVYVPQGTKAGALNIGTGVNDDDANYPYLQASTNYEPNQNVIMTGVTPANLTAPYSISTRMARNLNSGDSVYLVFRTLVYPTGIPNGGIRFSGTLDYCITY